MSENTAAAACTAQEWNAARTAGLLFADPGSTAHELAIHRFAKAIREPSAALVEVVGQILDAGHLNTEDLARLRAAWEAA